MEITEKDFELIDNYLDGTLSREEYALFKIRMQDDEFAGFLKFQQQLKEELADTDRSTFFHPVYEPKKEKKSFFSRELTGKLAFIVFITMVLSAFVSILLLR